MATDAETVRIEAVLDRFHAAAASADEAAYLAQLSPDAVFLGTDGGERWAGETYRAFIHSYFSRGIGWTYVPSQRTVDVAADGGTAWFDEQLDNESYGVCRGTGVLQRRDGEWRIEQYSLSIPLPNELAGEIVARIRETG